MSISYLFAAVMVLPLIALTPPPPEEVLSQNLLVTPPDDKDKPLELLSQQTYQFKGSNV